MGNTMEREALEYEKLALSCRGKQSLDLTIKAVEHYMKAIGQSTSVDDKKRMNKKCNELVLRAEGIKESMRVANSASNVANSASNVETRIQLPQQTRQIPTSEKTILYRNSRLHGNTFAPWDSDPGPSCFHGETYSDPSSFTLSPKQTAILAGWKRATELRDEVFKCGTGSNSDSSVIEMTDGRDLVQDITTDCSVVASLCAIMKHFQPGPTSILPALMFPTNPQDGRPQVSANGRYVFRMFFNGCFRRVVIDDRLPASSNGRFLYVVDRQNPSLVWPALIEKAYLKIRGGYDFPGSNSCTDLSILTGWIPQQLFLQSDDMDRDATWRRVKKAYDSGDVVVTLGTGHLSPDEEDALGLIGEHNYAVLDLSDIRNHRRLLVKNPWCDGLVWKGVGSASSQTPDDTGDHPTELKPGTFWISFDDVSLNFESLYLNWNPALFMHREDHHFEWEIPEPNVLNSFADNPQYSMKAARSGQIWVLLSRHFQDKELEICRQPSTTLAGVSNMLGFMSIYIFENDGQRVQLSNKSVYRGPFVDSPQTLAPFEARQGVSYTVVVATQDMPLPKYSFTLTFFSRMAIDIAPARHAFSHYTELHSSWTRRTSGGNSMSPLYVNNPQFSITLPQDGPLSILLSTAEDDIPVHVDLVWAKGQRVAAVTVRDLVTMSGDYRRRCALASAKRVDAGTYTIVCSTFEPGQLADFTMRIGSDVPCIVAPIPADGAGRLRTQLPPLLAFCDNELKMRASISVRHLTRLGVVVTREYNSYNRDKSDNSDGSSGGNKTIVPGRSTASSSGTGTPRSRPTIRATLEYGQGPHRDVLASSGQGEFQEIGLGLRIPECDVNPLVVQSRGLWLVIELMGSTLTGSTPSNGIILQAELLSDRQVSAGIWETVEN